MLARPYLASSVFPITSLQPMPFHEVTHSFAPRRSAIHSIINEFRTLSVCDGGGAPLHFPGSARLSPGGLCVLAWHITPSLLWAGKVGLAMANLIFTGHFDFDFPIGVSGTSRSGVVPQPILHAQFAVDAIENTVQFACGVGEEHGATH